MEMMCYSIWSWSPMPSEKHGPRDSVDKNQRQKPKVFFLLRPDDHVFHTAWEAIIRSYYNMLTDWFFPRFINVDINFTTLKWTTFSSLYGC